MTDFEKALESVRNGELQAPSVHASGNDVDYFGYQLATHKFNLSVMSRGMTFRGIKFTQIKKYYGLKGRGAKDCLPQLEKIIADYSAGLI